MLSLLAGLHCVHIQRRIQESNNINIINDTDLCEDTDHINMFNNYQQWLNKVKYDWILDAVQLVVLLFKQA